MLSEKSDVMESTELSDYILRQDLKSEITDNYSPVNNVILSEEDSLKTPNFGSGHELSDVIPAPLPVFCESEDNDETVKGDTEVIIHIMNIRTRLSKFRSMLEQRMCADLTGYTFWLQGVKMLKCHETLVDQCVCREGVVQVNIQVKSSQKKINIMDVLKPDEKLVHLSEQSPISGVELDPEIDDGVMPCVNPDLTQNRKNRVLNAASRKWIVDEQFKKDQKRWHISNDLSLWSVQHVRLWVQWAVRQFKLHGIRLSDWNITGQVLMNLVHSEFKEKVPNDPGDIFWTHLELLRSCNIVAVQSEEYFPQSPDTAVRPSCIIRKKQHHLDATLSDEEIFNMSTFRQTNTHIKLWQFLLDLLTNAYYSKIICWYGTQGEFKFLEPQKVAHLWGIRKNKPAMNYDKLARALRYYYDGNIIAKVSGKKFVYKCVCNLEQMIGFHASELSEFIAETNDAMQSRRTVAYKGH